MGSALATLYTDDNQFSSSDQEKLKIGELSFMKHKLCLQLESTLHSSLVSCGISRHKKANRCSTVPATVFKRKYSRGSRKNNTNIEVDKMRSQL